MKTNAHFTRAGKDIDPNRVQKAGQTLGGKILLGKTTEITHDFEVVEG